MSINRTFLTSPLLPFRFQAFEEMIPDPFAGAGGKKLNKKSSEQTNEEEETDKLLTNDNTHHSSSNMGDKSSRSNVIHPKEGQNGSGVRPRGPTEEFLEGAIYF